MAGQGKAYRQETPGVTSRPDEIKLKRQGLNTQGNLHNHINTAGTYLTHNHIRRGQETNQNGHKRREHKTHTTEPWQQYVQNLNINFKEHINTVNVSGTECPQSKNGSIVDPETSHFTGIVCSNTENHVTCDIKCIQIYKHSTNTHTHTHTRNFYNSIRSASVLEQIPTVLFFL